MPGLVVLAETSIGIAEVVLLSRVGKRALRSLASAAKAVEHAAGHQIVEEGGAPLGFHLITEGEAVAEVGGRPGQRVEVFTPKQGDPGEALLARCLSPPNFPIVPSQLGPGWSFQDIDEGRLQVEGFDVLAREIPHKGGRTFGYRVSADGGSMAYLSDHSPTSVGPGPDGLGERHAAALELADGVDVLIHDAQHRAAEFPGVGYLGHASVEYAVSLGIEAGVGTVVLFHHAPTRTDDEIDDLLAAAHNPGVKVVAAYEGLVLEWVAVRS